MSRTPVPFIHLGGTRAMTDVAGVALNPADGHVVERAPTVRPRFCLLRITTGTTGGEVILRASASWEGHIRDDVSHIIPADTTVWLSVLDDDTFNASGFDIDLDPAMSSDGTILALGT